MRAKLCEDGRNRILAKVVVPMGLNEVALFAMSHPQFHDSDTALNAFEKLNKRQIFNIAKESVELRGSDIGQAADIASTTWTSRHYERAVDHVKMLFPEVN
jgi:phosphomevalonate kinase